MKFMIVDDSRLSRKKLSDFIRTLGYEVSCEAINGVDALEKFRKFEPNYILTDLEMPQMKGDELSKRILEIQNDVTIIIVTTIMDKKELLNVIRLGVKKVMNKPITLENLRMSIDELKERR